jgi:hypothetical protein
LRTRAGKPAGDRFTALLLSFACEPQRWPQSIGEHDGIVKPDPGVMWDWTALPELLGRRRFNPAQRCLVLVLRF